MRIAPVDAADSAGAHETDPRSSAHGEGPADSGRSDRALRDADGEVAWSRLARVGIESLELVERKADADLAVEHADGRRNCACLTDALFGLRRDRDALPPWEAVGDECRLERNDGTGLAHLVGDADHGIAPT